MENIEHKYATRTDLEFIFALLNKEGYDEVQDIISGMKRIKSRITDKSVQNDLTRYIDELDDAYYNEKSFKYLYEDFSHDFQNAIPVEAFGKFVADTIAVSDKIPSSKRGMVIQYVITQYPETEKDIFTSINLFWQPVIFNSWLEKEIRKSETNPQIELEIPNFLKTLSHETMNKLFFESSNKDFSKKTFFKYLDKVNPEEAIKYLDQNTKVLDKLKDTYEFRKKHNKDDIFQETTENKAILESNIEINLNPFFFKHKIKTAKEKKNVEYYMNNKLGRYNGVQQTWEDGICKITVRTVMGFSQEYSYNQENPNDYKIYTDLEGLNYRKKIIYDSFRELEELIETKSFKEYVEKFDPVKKFITDEMQKDINDEVQHNRDVKKALELKSVIHKNMETIQVNNNEEDNDVTSTPSHHFKI